MVSRAAMARGGSGTSSGGSPTSSLTSLMLSILDTPRLYSFSCSHAWKTAAPMKVMQMNTAIAMKCAAVQETSASREARRRCFSSLSTRARASSSPITVSRPMGTCGGDGGGVCGAEYNDGGGGAAALT